MNSIPIISTANKFESLRFILKRSVNRMMCQRCVRMTDLTKKQMERLRQGKRMTCPNCGSDDVLLSRISV